MAKSNRQLFLDNKKQESLQKSSSKRSASLNHSLNLCYNIGDVGPEGGIIFSVPGVGPNTSTNIYYEVAQSDIAIANTSLNDFNTACLQEDFTAQYNPLSYTAVSTAIEADDNILIDTGLPANSQFLNGLNSGVIAPGTLVNTGLTPNNQPMFNHTPTVPGEPIASINYLPNQIVELVFNTAILNSYIPPLTTNISFFTLGSFASTSWGWEWGAYNIPYSGPPYTIQTSIDFSFGIDNTDIIDAFPLIPGTPTGGTHPWSSTHGIAATLCKNYGTTNDWFLPSEQEFREIVNQLGSFGGTNQITFNSFGQNLEHFYWTSSQYIGTDASLQDPDKYSYAYDADANSMELAWRCHALSVRPIRSFECGEAPEPCPPPHDCNFEYNYRDGYGQLDGGFMGGGGFITTPTMDPAQIHWNTTNEGCSPGTPPVTLTSDSIIGGDELQFSALNRRDVLGNVYSDADFNNHTGYTISAWDTKYNFIGKWKYSTLHSLQSGAYIPGVQAGSPKYSYDRPGDDNYVILRLRNVQHLEGDYPVVYYAGKPDVPGSLGSHTAVFFKIEWDGNTGNYETGCNSTVFGNPHPYYSPGVPSTQSARDWPFYCGPLYLNNVYDRHVAIPRYATFQPFDLNGSTLLPVYPDIFAANSSLTPPYHSISQIWSNLSQPIGCGGVSTLVQNHCFSICAVHQNGIWYNWGNSWFGGEPYGPIAMENNPLGTTSPPFSSNPAIDQDYTDFYDWILTQNIVLPLNPGDTFMYAQSGYTMQFNVTDPTTGQTYSLASIQGICFKYRGIQYYNIPLDMLNDGYPTPLISQNTSSPYGCCGPGNPSSSMVPVEDDPNSIKLKVNARTLTKREEFIKSKEPKKTGPFGVSGYYPLYDNIDDAVENSPDSDYHIHEFGEQEFYMPEGLEMGVTQFHGDWAPEPEVPEAIIQLEEPEIITPPDEPEEETPPLTSETGY